MASARFRALGAGAGSVVAAGLAVGLAVAAFSVLDSVVLQPLPFPQAARLVALSVGTRNGTRAQNSYASWPDFVSWQARLGRAAQLAAFTEERVPVLVAGRPREVQALIVSPAFFTVLGVAPAVGAGWSVADGRRGAREVIVSSGFWRARLGGAGNAIGNPLLVGGIPYRVAGIMPAGFRYPVGSAGISIWLNAAAAGGAAPGGARDLRYWSVIGRLRPGVGVARAEAELGVVARGLARTYPATNAGLVRARVTPAKEVLLAGRAVPVWLIFAATILVLLAACANYAGAAGARAVKRRPEVALRRALGAGVCDLAGGVAAEAAWWGIGIFGVGIGAAALALRAVVALSPVNVPRLASVAIDWRAVAFGLGCAWLVGTVASLAVLAYSVRVDPAEVARGGGGEPVRGRGGTVVGVEVALGVLLAAAAAAMARTYVRTSGAPTGLRVAGVGSFMADMSSASYGGQPSQYRRAIEAMREVAGIRAVAAGTPAPLSGGQIILPAAAGAGSPSGGLAPASVHIVTPGYFRALGILMLHGRDFRWSGNGADAVVSRAWVLAHGGRDPVGRPLALRMEGRGNVVQRRTIIGEVADVADPGLGPLARSLPSIYVADSAMLSGEMTFVLRGTPASRRAAVGAFERAMPGAPVYAQRSLRSILVRLFAPARFATALLLALAFVAVAIAVFGVWSLAVMEASSRRREVAIRTALGARAADTALELARRGMVSSGLGAGAGVLLGVFAQPVLRHWQVGVPKCGLLDLAGVALALVVISLGAAVVVAFGAARSDPAAELRIR